MKPFLLLFALLPAPVLAAAREFQLPAPVAGLIQNDRVFEPFGRALAREVEGLLHPQSDPPNRKLLLSLRLHLALASGDAAKALETTKLIRAALPDTADRLYVGLTTQASIVAQRATRTQPGDPGFNGIFAHDFSARLAELPPSRAVLLMLEEQKERAIKTTTASLHAEIVALAAMLDGKSSCTMVEIDQLVRLRHRFHDLLPLRPQIVEALELAISTRRASGK